MYVKNTKAHISTVRIDNIAAFLYNGLDINNDEKAEEKTTVVSTKSTEL